MSTLHQIEHNKLNTSNTLDKIHENELIEIYCILLCNLNLKNEQTRKSWVFSRSYSYTFSVKQAIDKMVNLKISVKKQQTNTEISYKINCDQAFLLLQRFFDSKLIHCPSERTNTVVKQSLAMQPTPKGVAFLRKFCNTMGLSSENNVEIIESSFNSMKLINLERNNNGAIVYSRCLIYLIFIKMMGKYPNLWSSQIKKTVNIPEPKNITKNSFLDEEEDLSDPVEGSYASFLRERYNQQPQDVCTKNIDVTTSMPIHPTGPINEFPSFHLYFTNPESSACCQYFVSDMGVRLFKNYDFTDKNGKLVCVNLCFPGNAILQWLHDCTDILDVRQVMALANLMLQMRLIEPVEYSVAHYEYFVGTRFAFYTLSAKGLKISHWKKHETEESSFDDIPQSFDSSKSLKLNSILKDPGLRCLFKEHLIAELCLENYEAYCNFVKFKQKMQSLETVKDERLQERILNHCESLAYSIHATFLAFDAPSMLNIDFTLRCEISDLILQNKETTIEGKVNRLRNISILISRIRQQVLMLMEEDSVPKFLNSAAYKEATMTFSVLE